LASPDLRTRVLVVDDEETILRSLGRILTQAGCDVRTAKDGDSALTAIGQETLDVVLLDLRLPGGKDGLEILREIKTVSPQVEVILMTGYATVDDAVAAVKAGAYDFLTKPFDSADVVVLAVEKAAERRRLVDRLRHLERELEERGGFGEMVGTGPKMRHVFRIIESVAPSNSTVLILGESGTGKELVARAIHTRSPRRDRTFVPINCAAIPENLLESELFGTVAGAFTGAKDKRGLFEVAHKGTLFLDEIGEIPLALQAKLLRVLQEGEIRRVGETKGQTVDVRIIAATNVNLAEAKEKGTFREDLYYRLNVLPIRLPPLRERREDIPLLAAHFLRKHGRRAGKAMRAIEPEALARLQRHAWSGNVRELESTLERAVVICQGENLTDNDLTFAWEMADESPPRPAVITPAATAHDVTLPYPEAKQRAMEIFDRSYLTTLLAQTDGNVSVASRQAGLDRSNFRRLLRRYDIDPERYRKSA
jgi:DNA-binding NtrC family response regulator